MACGEEMRREGVEEEDGGVMEGPGDGRGMRAGGLEGGDGGVAGGRSWEEGAGEGEELVGVIAVHQDKGLLHLVYSSSIGVAHDGNGDG